MPHATTSPPGPRRVSTRLDASIARADARLARCRSALERLSATRKRTRRVRVILHAARSRLVLLRLGRSCLGS